MSVSRTFKESLTGASVVGYVFGFVAALLSVGFDSDYFSTPTMTASTRVFWVTLHAVEAFIVVAGSIIVLFGLGPVLLAKLLANRKGD